MVTLIPDKSLEEIDFNNSTGEEELYNEFLNLSDDFIIFHSLDWMSKNNNHLQFGEADFIIFNKNYGVISLEVKHGGIMGESGRIMQINRKNGNKIDIDPMFQADKSKYKFLKIFEDLNNKNNNKIKVYSMVWFTGVDKSNLNGSLPHKYFLDGNTFFRNHMKDVEMTFKTFFNFHNMEKQNIPESLVKEILLKISPEFSVFPSMSNLIEENDYYFNRMTNEQNYLLDYLDEQQLAVIQGGAGTGKTMLAVEKARRFPENEKVAFLCFNNLLMQSLKNQYGEYMPNVTFTNLNSLAAKALNKMPTDEDIIYFLENFEEYSDVWDFKHIIIDEAQDFIDETVVLLKEIAILNEGDFYVFYDKNQLVQRRDNLKWLDDMECRLLLSRNCRNTKNIAATSSKPIGLDKVKMRIDLPGEMPTYHNNSNKTQLLNWLEERIRFYTKNGVKRNQITILTPKTIEKSVISGISKIGNYKLVNDVDGKNITFTTARKFKGLEADIILFIDIDGEVFESEENRRVFYVGASRAKSQLELIAMLEENQEKDLFYNLSRGASRRKARLFSDLNVKLI